MQARAKYGAFFTSDNDLSDTTLRAQLLKKIDDYLETFPLWKKRPYGDGRDTAEAFKRLINNNDEVSLPHVVLEQIAMEHGKGSLGTSTDLRKSLTNVLRQYFNVSEDMIIKKVSNPFKSGVAASPYADTSLLAKENFAKATYGCIKEQIENRELAQVNIPMRSMSTCKK